MTAEANPQPNAPPSPGGSDAGPWHAGERAIHRRLGLDETIDPIGRRNIRPFMPDQHRLFFAQLPFAFLGALDRAGNPWATVLCGRPGFLASFDARFLHIDAYPPDGDPAAEGIARGARVALLGIELPTRRRNRMNGVVVDLDISAFTVMVEQSFGNCPQYIQRRHYGAPLPPRFPLAEALGSADEWARDLLRRADTAFVASSTPPGESKSGAGVDVSHRGGLPGFIRWAEDGALAIPDYRGNRYFNTFGNLLAYPHAGLAVPDFATGDLLQLTGSAEIVWEPPQTARFPAAERFWRVKPARMIRLRDAFPVQLSSPEFSPVLLAASDARP
jgi:uncharacterized protein